ncbi:MAG: molybdopterin-binding protein [Bacillota bacterium]
MKIEVVDTQDSIGIALAQDITQIIPKEFKGPRLKLGHVITENDVDILLDCGKRSVYVLKPEAHEVMENTAAQFVAECCCGAGVTVAAAKEGRVDLLAETDGLLKINRQLVDKINDNERIFLSTQYDNTVISAGENIAAAKIVPLYVIDAELDRISRICSESSQPVVKVLPFAFKSIGLIVTGSEVASGRIKDGFGDIIAEKLARYGSDVHHQCVLTDDADLITGQISEYLITCDIVIVTGGMSVDPDDVTPTAIRNCCDEIVCYGTPVLPGAMFMLAYVEGKPVVGFPACGMFAKATMFDAILPRLLAGDKPTASEIRAMGYGGLCRKCAECVYPNCGFART